MIINNNPSQIPFSKFGFRLIEEILSGIEKSSINYCVMRNATSIVNAFPAGDVDILIERGCEQLRNIEAIIYLMQGTHGFRVYATARHANVSRNYYISTQVNGQIHTINLEFFNEIFVYEERKFVSKKYNYLDTSDVLLSRTKAGAFYKCNALYEFTFKAVDTLFNNKTKNYAWLDKNIGEVRQDARCQEIFERTIGENATKILLEFNWTFSSERARHSLKTTTMSFLKENHGFPLISGLSRDVWSATQHVIQYLFPGGVFCYVMGTDGSGKTTLCDEFGTKRSRSFNKVHRIHLGNRPILLPSLRGEKGLGDRNQLPQVSSVNSHNYQRTKSVFSIYQTLRFLYNTLDYVLHYFLVLRWRLARGDIIITERYFSDYLVVPERYFPRVPLWIKKWCSILVPRANIEIHVEITTEEIVRRKQELPVDLIEFEIDRYRNHVLKSNIPQISNSGALSDTCANLEKVIFGRKFGK